MTEPAAEHGTWSAYTRGCRCRPCRDAAAAYMRDYRAGKRRNAAPHGTPSKYVAGCRCPECRAANAAYKRSRRALGTVRNHGASGYSNHGCRCDVCRAAWNAYQRDYNRRQQNPEAADNDAA